MNGWSLSSQFSAGRRVRLYVKPVALALPDYKSRPIRWRPINLGFSASGISRPILTRRTLNLSQPRHFFGYLHGSVFSRELSARLSGLSPQRLQTLHRQHLLVEDLAELPRCFVGQGLQRR
jgi:hypothetical protein